MTFLRIGLFEIGSRSFRYLVADIPEKIQDFKAIKIETEQHHIDPNRITRGDIERINKLALDISLDLREFSCDLVCIYGTEICRSIEKLYPGELSSIIRPLSTQEEAMATWAAAFLCLEQDETTNLMTVIDVGNGSTEIVRARWKNEKFIDLRFAGNGVGSSKLMQAYKNGGLSYSQLLQNELVNISIALQEAGINKIDSGMFYMTGGAATRIGWLSKRKYLSQDYRPDLVNGVKVRLDDLKEMYRTMGPAYIKNPQEVQRIIDPRKGSEEEALRVLSGSPYILELVTSIYEGETIRVSGYGLRHGMAFLLQHKILKSPTQV